MKTISEKTKAFVQGYMCALVVLIQSHGMSTEAKGVWAANKLSMAELKLHGVDNFDLAILKKHWKELNR